MLHFTVSKSESHKVFSSVKRSTHLKSVMASSSETNSHMQTLVQTGKVDQLEQEVYELRGEVTTLRAEVEKLTSLVSSLMATKNPPLVQQRPLPLCQPMCIKQPRQQVPQQFTPQNPAPQRLIPQNQASQQLNS